MENTKYQKDLIEALKNPAEAAAYLKAALEDGDKKTIVLVMRNIAEAYGLKAEYLDQLRDFICH